MNKIKIPVKIFLSSAFISLMLVSVPAFAFDGATLSQIKISSKDNYSYKIVLKTDKDVPVEKYITSDNKIVIDLKNTKSAESVNTVYNNTPEIDNVVVQTVSNDKIRVFIEGLNIASSKIILDSRNETLDLAEENNNAIPVNHVVAKPEPSSAVQNMPTTKTDAPIINLAQKSDTNLNEPLYSKPTALPVEKTSENDIQTVKTSMMSGPSLKKIFSKEGFDWILRIFALIFIAIGAFKFLSKPKNVTVDISAENLKAREIELYRSINERKELLSKSTGSSLNNVNRAKKSTSYGANVQYGVKEYQNSQLPPQRLNRPTENINRGINRSAELNSALKTTKTAAEVRRPAVNNSRVSPKDVKTAKTNIDNVKFLENMAAIYQKSGRDDLANNIRQNIMRTRTAG